MNLYQYCVLSEEEVGSGAKSGASTDREDYVYQVAATDKSQYSYSAMSGDGYSQYVTSSRSSLAFITLLSVHSFNLIALSLSLLIC